MEVAEPDLSKDPRWIKLHNTKWKCTSCDELHQGLLDFGCDRPDIWDGEIKNQHNSQFEFTDNILTEDFCVVDGEHFFVRCVLHLPIIGSQDQDFGVGVWSSLSEANFKLYYETFDDGQQSELGPWFGWFSNKLRGFPDTLNHKCQIHLRSERQRPSIELEPTDHPLSLAQYEGITFDKILDFFALYDHDIRDALA